MSFVASLLGRVTGSRAPLRRIRVNGLPLDVPTEFQGVLPALPQDPRAFDFEPVCWRALDAVLRSSTVAFDVGASYGVLTALMAKRVGATGRVCGFEGNEWALAKARLLAGSNHLGQISFHSCLVGERSESDTPFWVVPGISNAASTRCAEILQFHPDAHRIQVPMVHLDGFIAESGLIPDVVKIDIEGGEFRALEGAQRLLERHHPDLIIETHALEIEGVGGSLPELCGLLESFGYALYDVGARERVSGEVYQRRYAAVIGYLLASFRLDEPGVSAKL